MREFSVAVSDGVVDNSRQYYFIEPFAVQVRHRPGAEFSSHATGDSG
jgi:hypothetical protein